MARHDQGYRALFSQPEMVRDLILGCIRQDWVDDLDLDSLEQLKASYVTSGLERRESDSVWRVRLRRGDIWLYLYLLFEFQSTVDQHMALRLLAYLALLYQDILRMDLAGPGGLLPPVLPVVIYNGTRPWKAPLSMGRLILPVSGDLARYRPELRYLLIAARDFKGEELPEGNLAGALFALEQCRSPAEVRRVVQSMSRWLRAPEQEELRQIFTAWINQVLLPMRVPGADIPRVNDLIEVDSMLEERVKEWTREWMEEGLRKGMRKGMLTGIGRSLRLQIGLKFGEPSPEVEERLERASEAELLRWTERILSARSLDEVFQE